MDNQKYIDELTAERNTLSAQVIEGQKRLIQLDGAIAALMGKPIVPTARKAEGPSVTTLVEAMLPERGVVFDQQKIASMAIAQNPSFDQKKLKRGVYPAFKQLIKQGKIRLCPGGYCVI